MNGFCLYLQFLQFGQISNKCWQGTREVILINLPTKFQTKNNNHQVLIRASKNMKRTSWYEK